MKCTAAARWGSSTAIVSVDCRATTPSGRHHHVGRPRPSIHQTVEHRRGLNPQLPGVSRDAAKRGTAELAKRGIILHADHGHVVRNAEPETLAFFDHHAGSIILNRQQSDGRAELLEPANQQAGPLLPIGPRPPISAAPGARRRLLPPARRTRQSPGNVARRTRTPAPRSTPGAAGPAPTSVRPPAGPCRNGRARRWGPPCREESPPGSPREGPASPPSEYRPD